MKKTFKYILLLLSIIILFSCGKGDNIKESNKSINTNTGIVITQVEQKNLNNEVSFDKKKQVLSVGDITIKSGLPDNFPKEIKIYKNSKTYVNSNVENYIYFVADKNTNTKNIFDFYLDIFKKNGYEFNQEKYNNNIDFGELEFYIKNPNFIPIGKRTIEIMKEKSDKKIDFESEYDKNVKIYIKKETPENIKKGMGLDGVFVEIYY